MARFNFFLRFSFLFFLSIYEVKAQAPFEYRYGAMNSWFNSTWALQLPDSGYISCGCNYITLGGTIIRYDASGQPVWAKQYNYASPYGSVNFTSMVICSDSEFVAAGFAGTTSETYYTLLRLRTDGSVIWSKTYQIPGAYPVVTPSGGIVVATPDSGFALSGILFEQNLVSRAFLMKVDGQGNLLWSKLINYVPQCSFCVPQQQYDLRMAHDTLLLSTQAQKDDLPTTATIEKIFIGRVNMTSGALIDSRFYYSDSLTTVRLYSHEALSDGGILYSGQFQDSTTHFSAFLLKTDRYGTIQWAKEYHIPGVSSAGYYVFETSDHKFVVAAGIGTFTIQVGLFKTDFQGNLLWYYGYPEAALWSANPDRSDGYLLTGNSTIVTQQQQVYLIHTDSSGHSGCDTAFSCYTRSIPFSSFVLTDTATIAVVVDSVSDVLITPFNFPATSCSLLTGIAAASEKEPACYPNPSAGTIRLGNRAGAQVRFFNLQGQLVFQTITQFPDEQLDVSMLANGVYILEITSEKKPLLREKIILQKL